MPANLTPQYRAAEERYRAATDPEEKVAALREMLAIIPKHKGTEKLQADLKQRIAKLAHFKDHGGAKRTTFDHVPREGAGQVVLIGPPNAGKSSLLAALTRAEPVIAAYPFTTHVPQPGMMPFEDIMIQLVDTPAIAAEHTPPWLPGLIRSADLALLMVDLTEPALLEQVDFVLARLAQSRVQLVAPGAAVEAAADGEDHAVDWVTTIVAGNRSDLPEAGVGSALLAELLAGRLPIRSISALARHGLEDLRREIFILLDVIRVYAKEPGKPADRERPFVLKRGATVADFAISIHRDLANQMRFARVWGTRTFDGQTVHRDHPLADGDVLELHA
jgi:ribosome-interacting GTPase 1